MVAVNFTVFQDKILSGEKRQTVRATARCKPGDRLQLYTGMRTKACRKLGEAVCEAVFPVTIGDWSHEAFLLFPADAQLFARGFYRAEGKLPRRAARDRFARADGFSSFEACAAFFRRQYGLPFAGHVIVWRDFQPAEEADV